MDIVGVVGIIFQLLRIVLVPCVVCFSMSEGLFYMLDKPFPGSKCILLSDEDLKEDVCLIGRHSVCTCPFCRCSSLEFKIKS